MKRSKFRRSDLSAIYADISGSASQELCADESSEDSLVDVGFVKGQPTIGPPVCGWFLPEKRGYRA